MNEIITAYHGTPNEFEFLEPFKTHPDNVDGRSILGDNFQWEPIEALAQMDGIWFANDPLDAEGYTNLGSDERVCVINSPSGGRLLQVEIT